MMYQGEFLKKDENQGWDLYEDLAEKIIQWESCQISIKIKIQQLSKSDYTQ